MPKDPRGNRGSLGRDADHHVEEEDPHRAPDRDEQEIEDLGEPVGRHARPFRHLLHVLRDAIVAKRDANFGEHVARIFPIGIQKYFANVDRSACFGAAGGAQLGELEVLERAHELEAMRIRFGYRDAVRFRSHRRRLAWPRHAPG